MFSSNQIIYLFNILLLYEIIIKSLITAIYFEEEIKEGGRRTSKLRTIAMHWSAWYAFFSLLDFWRTSKILRIPMGLSVSMYVCLCVCVFYNHFHRSFLSDNKNVKENLTYVWRSKFKK